MTTSPRRREAEIGPDNGQALRRRFSLLNLSTSKKRGDSFDLEINSKECFSADNVGKHKGPIVGSKKRENENDGGNFSLLRRRDSSFDIDISPVTINTRKLSISQTGLDSSPILTLGSKRWSFGTRRSLNTFNNIEYSSESLQLERLLSDKSKVDELADILLAEHQTEACSYLRFISAVMSLERSRGKPDEKPKVKKIFELFLDSNSRFCLPFVTEELQKEIADSSSKIEVIFKIKLFILTELLKNPSIVEFVNNETSELLSHQAEKTFVKNVDS